MTVEDVAKKLGAEISGHVRPAPDAWSWHCTCGDWGVEFERTAAELALYMHRRHDPKHRVSSP